MKDYEDEAFDDIERAQGWRKRQILSKDKDITQLEAMKLARDFISRLKFADAEPEPEQVMQVLDQAIEQAQNKPDFEKAYLVWQDKTEWVQETVQPHELGMHRADVLKQRIEQAQKQEPAPVAKNEGGSIKWLVDDWPQNCFLYAEPPTWTPVEIGVDVTSDGAHVVGMYVLPDAVRYVFYSQFHPMQAQKQEPLDMPLPCDVKVGHVTMRKGVALRTLVARMQVLYDMAQAPQRQPLTDEQKYALIEKHLGLKKRREATVIDPWTGRYTDAQRYFDLIDETAHGIKGEA